MVTIPPSPPSPPASPPVSAAPASVPVPAPAPAKTAPRSIAPFRAMVLKEVRERGPFIALVWGGLGLIAGYLFVAGTEGGGRSYFRPYLLMDPTLLKIVPPMVAGLGLIMGFMMHRAQSAFDAWAFYVHRPISRARIFAYKHVAGLGLYAVTVLVPMGLFIGWAISNKQATPLFHWRMLLPYAADFLAGIVAFMAGSLIAQRQARFFGTRFIPGLVAINAVMVSVSSLTFEHVVLMDVIAIGALTLAAWGSALTHGERSRGPMIARIALGVTLLLGLLLPSIVVHLASSTWVAEYLQNQIQISRNAPKIASTESMNLAQSRLANMQLVMLDDGQVGIREWTVISHPAKDGGNDMEREAVAHYLTLTGEPLPNANPMTGRGGTSFSPAEFLGSVEPGYRNIDSIMYPAGPDELHEFPNGGAPIEWLYFPHDRTLACYRVDPEDNKIPRERIASLGPSGFRDGNAAPEPFDSTGNRPLLTQHNYYFSPNYQRKTIEHISFPNDTILDMGSMLFGMSDGGAGIDAGICWVFRTETHLLIVYYGSHKTRAVLPLRQPHGRQYLTVTSSVDRILLTYHEPFFSASPVGFDLFDGHGKPLQSTTVDPRATILGPYYAEQDERYGNAAAKNIGDLNARYPGLKYRKFEAGMVNALGMPLAFSVVYFHAPADAMGHEPYMLAGNLVVNVLAALGMVFLARRYRLRRWSMVLWVIAMLAMGPVLMVVFAGLFVMPVRMRCAGCGKWRALGDATCPACGAGFAGPARNGTEILLRV